jgi:type II secretory pathway pseudopilin PulG
MAQFAPLILAAVAGGVSASQSYKAGQQANNEYKSMAKQEQDSARQQEIEKRRNLLRALSSQNAQAGAQGVSTAAGTGKAAIAQRNINENRSDLLTDKVNTKRKQAMFISKGRAAARAGEMEAIGTLLETGSKVAGGM